VKKMIRTETWVLIDLLSLPNSRVAVPAFGDGAEKVSEMIWAKRDPDLSGSGQQVIYS